MRVLDASLLANAVGDDGAAGERARALVAEGPVVLPDLADVEAVAVLRGRRIAGTLDATRFTAAVSDLADLPLVRVPARPLLERMAELAANLAPYVALAEVLDAELVTADARLSRAPGPLCPIRLVTEPA